MITIDGYAIDAAVAEDHQFDNEVTDNPIERGGVTTDHTYKNPDVLAYDCVVTDHPLGPMRDIRDPAGAVPSEDAYQRLTFIRDRGTAVVIVDSLGVHTDMMLTKLGIPRRAADGEALRFRVEFKKATFVENQLTLVRVAVPQQAKRVNRGNKPAKTPPDTPPAEKSEENASILYKLVH